jgi:hypothetical protein
VEPSQSSTALECMQVQRWCYPQTACVALSNAAMIGSRPWARWCWPVECVSRRSYSDAMVPSGTLLPFPAGIIHRDAAPADRAGRLRFAVFRGAGRDDDALAVRKWCRFLRCPAWSEQCVSGPWLSQPGTCDFIPTSDLTPAPVQHTFLSQCTQRPHATALLRRQRTPAAAASSNDCAPRTGLLTSFDSRASLVSRQSIHRRTAHPSFPRRALHPACHERCSHPTHTHHHDLGQ